MTKHQKRLSVPKSWPVERKTETFTAKADAGPHGESGVPLVVVLRDVLEYVNSKKEANYAIDTAGVLVNGDTVNDVNRPIGMFDILSFPDRDEYYRVFPDEGGRLGLTPIAADAADSKLGKIEDKTVVSGGQVQLNLHDGQNLLVEEDDYSGSDSVVVDNETRDVVAHFVLKEGALVTAVRGQHAGEIGEVADIQVTPGSADNTIVVDTDDGSFETVEEYIVVIDENFVGGSADDASDAAVDETEDAESDDESADADEEAESDEDAEAADSDDESESGDADESSDESGGDDE